jgi:hypothetical protein
VPLNQRRSGDPRTAALVPATKLRSKLRGNAGLGTEWQRRVIRYDRDGPGVLGYYLDTVGLLASLCPLVPETMGRDGVWTRSDDPVLNVTLAGYKSELFSQPELVATHTRHREALGECWIIWSEDIGWIVATIPNVTSTRSGDSIDFTDPYGNKRRISKERAWKSWIPDPYEPWLPTSPVRRAIPELRRLNAATRNQTRSAESRLVMNGLLAFPTDDGGARPLREAVNGGPQKDGVEQVLDDYVELAKESFDDDDAPSASVPFPYIGAPATYIELGRSIDGGALQVEEKALEAFARSVNFPAQLLTMGPGAANHWNEWLLQDVQHKMGLAPKLVPVCNDITEFYFRPMLRNIKNRVGSWNVNPDRVRVSFDMSFLTKKPDTTSQAMEAYRLGIASRDQVADMLGIDDQMVIPTGLSEYEHWELATGGKGAPYAEVDPDGRLIIAPPPGEMPMMDEQMPPEEPMMDEQLPPEEPMMDEQMPAAEPSTTEMQAPPAGPPAVTAALTSEERAVRSMVNQLGDIDVRLEAELSGLVAAIKATAEQEVAKEVIKQLPPRSAERARLRALPADQVWEAVPEDVRRKVDVAGIMGRVTDQYEQSVQDVFDDAAAQAQETWEEQGLTVPQFLLAAGVTVLLAGITAEIVGAFGDLLAAPVTVPADLIDDVVDRERRRARRRRRAMRSGASSMTIRSAMSAAAGGKIDTNNRLVPSQSGMPATVDGQPWQGSTGMALGHQSAINFLRLPDWRLNFEWKHSFFGRPNEPFEPHLALDGRQFVEAADVPGGMFPGDHPHCRCALLWVPEKVN